MSKNGEPPVDPSQIHLHNETNRLDPNILSTIESSLTPPERTFYDQLRTKTVIRFWNRRKHDARVTNLAFSYSYTTHHDVWLEPDDGDLKDTFLHELGQVYNFLAGYRGADAKNQWDMEMRDIATNINNAFIGAIAEKHLEESGIDRSYYKTRMIKTMKNFLSSCPQTTQSNISEWKRPLIMSQCVYMYVVNKLTLRDAFVTLEELWWNKIRVPEIRLIAKNIYKDATLMEIAPKRYSELQRKLAVQLGVQNYVQTGKPASPYKG